MGVFIEFNHEILRAESLDVDGPVLVMDCLGNLRYRLLLRDGAIAQGSLVTQYRPNGRSEFQYVYHRYQPNLQVLEAEEQVGSVVVGGEQLVGTGMAVKKGDQWVKWGLWQGDKFSGYFKGETTGGNPAHYFQKRG